MKKILSILFFVLCSLFVVAPVFAAPEDTPTPTQNVVSVTPTPPPVNISTFQPPPGTWQVDNEVTFAGKIAARSAHMINWILANTGWAQDSGPISQFWRTISNIVYLFLAIIVLATAFVLIITKGKSIAARRFIPRFIFSLILITLSFSLLQLLYQITDAITQIFLKNPDGSIISSKDLLNVAFDYNNFKGLKRVGVEFEESAFISLLLVKITAVTFYVMSGILMLRKIILWFFIAVSPVFPLLLFYYPIRNTAKIWIGEFFRWLLYAPLFAIFLFSLVSLWKSDLFAKSLFLSDQQTKNENINCQQLIEQNQVCYPIAVNILLGGPGQLVEYENEVGRQNSINRPDTFVLYVVALIMLWVVILLPFVLLQIFLDYFFAATPNENSFIKTMIGRGTNFFQKPQNPISPPPPPAAGIARSIPLSQGPIGLAKPLVDAPAFTGMAREIPKVREQPLQVVRQQSIESLHEITKLTNLTVPSIRDIARFETSTISKDIRNHEEVAKVHETLEKIANPSVIPSPIERQQFVKVQESLVAQKQSGNAVASAVLSAASSVSPSHMVTPVKNNAIGMMTFLKKLADPQTIQNSVEREKISTLKETLKQESQKGNQFASAVLIASSQSVVSTTTDEQKQRVIETVQEKLKEKQEEKDLLSEEIIQLANGEEKAERSIEKPAQFPVANRVQQVSLEDYESVKKLWEENYKKLDPPVVSGNSLSRKEWVERDIRMITETINLLLSSDPAKTKEGMNSVSSILPFLLIGGFSQNEVISYLRAKQEAAKGVLSDIAEKEEDEQNMIDVQKKKEEQQKVMLAEAQKELTDDETKNS